MASVQSVGYGPHAVVNGPVPLAPRVGLVKQAVIVPTDDDRWINGVQVWPYPADDVSSFDPCGTGSPAPFKGDGEAPETAEFAAQTLYLPITCTARSIHDQDTYVARATIAMEANESAEIEDQFWSGTAQPLSPHLTDANATVLFGGAPTDVFNGLAELEGAIAATGRAGMIHAPWPLVSVWSSNYQVYWNGSTLQTVLGTIVVAGAGYDGSGPAGEAVPSAGQSWAFATGLVELRRSDLFVIPGTIAQAITMSPNRNDITYRAERYALATWDRTLQAGILIDRCQTGCVATP